MPWEVFGPATLGENDELFAAVKRAYPEIGEASQSPIPRHPPGGGERVVWVGKDGAPAGFATYYPIEELGAMWLDLLWVAKASRRMGIATALVQAVVQDCNDKAKYLLCGIGELNEPSLHLFRSKLGWEPFGRQFCVPLVGRAGK